MCASRLLVVAIIGLNVTAGSTTADDLLQARRQQIANMTPAEQQELLLRQERFNALPAEEQDRLRALQAAVDADPSAARLRQVLAHYHEWLKTLTPSQRAKLADLPAQERVAEIKRIQQQQQSSRERMQRADLLSRDDMHSVLRWTEDFVWTRRQNLVEDMPKEIRQKFDKWDRQKQRGALLFRAYERARRPGSSGGLESLEASDIERLSAKLSEPAREALAAAATPDAQRKLIGSWIGTSIHRLEPWGRSRRQNTLVADELLQYLQNEVPALERERLLKMPREKMLEELRSMYFERSRRETGPGGPPGSPRFDGRPGDRSPGGFRGKAREPSRPSNEEPREDKSSEERKPAENPRAEEN